MNWYLEVLKKYVVFDGRARRKEYWMFFLVNFLIAFALSFVFGFIGSMLGIGGTLGNLVNAVYTLAVFLPGLAVAIRRLHDSGRCGWWILVPVANLVFLCLDSEPGVNVYGPNPKAV